MARRRALRILLLGAGGVLALVGAGVVGGVVWLNSDTGNAWVEAQALAAADAALPGELSVGELDAQVLRRIELRDVELKTEQGKPVVRVRRLGLRYGLGGLLRKEIKIHAVEADGVDVDMEMQDDGQIDLLAAVGVEPTDPNAPPEPSEPWAGLGGWTVDLDRLALSNVSFRYRDATDPEAVTEVAVEGASLETQATARGRRVALPELRLRAKVGAPVATPVALDGGLVLDQGDLTLDGLELRLQESSITAGGSIAAVETEPRFDLSLSPVRVSSAEVNRLVGDEVLQADLSLDTSVAGPLEALAVRARVQSPETGSLDLDAAANVMGDPLTWSVVLQTTRFDLQALLPPVTEPVLIDGTWSVRGAGVAWPDGLDAEFDVQARDQVLWGEPVSNLVLLGSVSKGVVSITKLQATHPVGRVEVDGSVDVTASDAVVQVRAQVPGLGALSRYGAPPMAGSARYAGSVRASWGGDDVAVQTSGTLSGAGIALPEQDVRLAGLQGPLVASFRGGRLEASGTLTAREVVAPSLGVQELQLAAWRASWSEAAGAEGDTELSIHQLSVGDGAVQVERILGTAGGGVNAASEPFADADLIISELLFGESGVSADGGPITLAILDDKLSVQFDLARQSEPFFEGDVKGDLATGTWEVAGLVLAPLSDAPWRSPRPVTFQLVDGGVRSLDLALSGEAGSVEASGDWVGATASGTDLRLRIDALKLDAVGRIVDAYVPGTPDHPSPLEGVAGSLDLEARLSDGSGDRGAGIAVDARLREFVYPGLANPAAGALTVSGALGRPTATLDVGQHGEPPLLTASATIPMVLEGGLPAAPDCDATGRAEVALHPGDLKRISSLVQDLPLPAGEASAWVKADGPVCDPDVVLAAAAAVDVGTRGETLRLDLNAARQGDEVTVKALGFESLARRLEVRGTARTRISEVVAAMQAGEEGGPDPSLPSTWVDQLDVSVVPTALPLSTLSMVADIPSGVRGTLAGGVNIAGRPLEPTLSGALMIIDGQLGAVPLSQAQLLVSPWASESDGAPGYRLESHVTFGEDGERGGLDLAGYVPLRINLDQAGDQDLTAEGLRLSISGDGVPLAILPGLIPGVPEASGRLTLKGDVGGSLAAPSFSASAGLEGGELQSEELGLALTNLDLDLDVDGERISLRKLQVYSEPLYGSLFGGKAEAGRANLAGVIVLDDLRPGRVELHLSADDAWLIASNDTQIQADARINATGNWPNVKVAGTAELQQGRVALSEDVFKEGSSLQLDRALTVHRKRAVEREKRDDSLDFLQDFDVELDVDLHRGLKLLASVPTADDYGEQASDLFTLGVDLELSSQTGLKVQLVRAEPVVNGTLELSRGELTIMNRDFDVSGGTVSFVSDVYDPILDITAVHRTGNYGDITVDVAGTASQPELNFSSDQYPDQTDVMAILVIGKPPSEMSESEGQMGGELLSLALSSVANNLSRTVSTAFLGQVEFDGDSFKMGIPLPAKNLFATMEFRSTDDEEENKVEVTLEWLLSRRLSAELVTGDAAQTSADLYYRWRF